MSDSPEPSTHSPWRQPPIGSVLIIAPSAYPLGGLATWLDYLIPGLEQAGWAVRLALTVGDFHDIEGYCRAHPLANVVPVHNPTGSVEGRLRSLSRLIGQQRPDIVLGVNIVDIYPAVERLRAQGRGDVRVVQTLHGIQPDLYEDIMRFNGILDAVICTNRLACRLVSEECGLAADRTLYAPYGVEVPRTTKRAATDKAENLVIAYVGRFDAFQKRVGDIAQIAAELDRQNVGYSLLLAGGGPEEAALRHQLGAAVGTGRVRFLGSLGQAELQQQVYAAADVLLVTSSWETGPIVAWEAMANKVAVATSEYIGSGLEGSLVDGLNCLTFPVGNVHAAVNCIRRLLDRDLRIRLVAGGFELVTERYSRERSIAAWDHCLRSVKARPLVAASCKITWIPPPSGRLDRLLGTGIAETLRRALGRRFRHSEPGGEWPHTFGRRLQDDAAFWKVAARLDHRTSASPSNEPDTTDTQGNAKK